MISTLLAVVIGALVYLHIQDLKDVYRFVSKGTGYVNLFKSNRRLFIKTNDSNPNLKALYRSINLYRANLGRHLSYYRLSRASDEYSKKRPEPPRSIKKYTRSNEGSFGQHYREVFASQDWDNLYKKLVTEAEFSSTQPKCVHGVAILPNCDCCWEAKIKGDLEGQGT